MERIAELKNRLQTALELREKKAVDLVKDLKIPKSAVSQYLSGKSQKMDSQRLYAICRYLNVSEPWMLGFDVPMERTIQNSPIEKGMLHAEMVMDKDLIEIFEDFKKLSDSERKIVKDLVHSLAATKKEA